MQEGGISPTTMCWWITETAPSKAHMWLKRTLCALLPLAAAAAAQA